MLGRFARSIVLKIIIISNIEVYTLIIKTKKYIIIVKLKTSVVGIIIISLILKTSDIDIIYHFKIKL